MTYQSNRDGSPDVFFANVVFLAVFVACHDVVACRVTAAIVLPECKTMNQLEMCAPRASSRLANREVAPTMKINGELEYLLS